MWSLSQYFARARQTRPRTSARRLAPSVAVALGLAAVGLRMLPGPAALASPDTQDSATADEEKGRARPDQSLQEAYSLVATWDGAGGQGPPGSLFQPAGVDLTREAVFIVEPGNDRVQRFSPGGAFQAAFGSQGSGAGELSQPHDVVVEGNRLAVSDTGNQRIVWYDLDGAWLEQWSPAGMGRPWGVAGGYGRLYVTIPDSGEVLIMVAGAITTRLPGFDDPRGITTGPDGRVYVAEAGANRIRILRPDGSGAGGFETALSPLDVDVDVANDVWVLRRDAILWYPAGASASRLAMYYDGLQGLAVSEYTGIFATVASDKRQRHWVLHYPWRPREGLPDAEWRILGYPPGRMNAPHAIHAAPDGRMWLLDAWPRAQAFDKDGRPLAQVVLPAAAVDVAATSGGDLIVGEARRMLRVSSTGAVTGAIRLARGTTDYWLTALALDDREQRARFLDASWLQVREYGLTRTLQPLFIEHPVGSGGGWELMWDIAVPEPNTRDRAYVANRTTGEIEVYEGWARVDTFGVDGRVIRVAVDSSENVYALTLDGLVWKLDKSGTLIAGWDVSAFSAGESLVVDLAVDDEERVYTVDRAAHTVRVWAEDPDIAPEPPLRRGGACAVRGDKRAAPDTVRLGDEVTVRLSVGGRCPQSAPRADIMLVIDQSYSMVANGGITATLEAAREFIGRIDFARDRVGVVAFNNTPQMLSPLTSSAAEALAALDRIEPIGGTEIALAIRAATAELYGPNARDEVQPVIVLLTDGQDREADAVLAEAAEARSRGTRVFTIGFGDIDPMVMVLAASSPEDYYFAPDAGSLLAIYTEIASRISASVLAKTLVLVDELPADMVYRGPLEGPAPVVAGSTLRWNLSNVPLEGITLSYRVAPQMLGLRPTNVRADADFVDGLDAAGNLRFPVPRVQVISEAPTPTPTRTPFPTPTRPPQPATLYLPITLWQRCHESSVHADVALVMDTSNSMLEPGQEGGTKLDAAIAAARIFLEQLQMPDDRAAIVAFNTDATVAAPLTGDRTALLAALEALETGAGTRIDRGLSEALAELTREPPQSERNRVVVMLTDGRTADVSNEDILATARAVKDAGVLVFTIGLGADVDHVLMTGIASRPEWYFVATDAAALAGIYRQIAYELPCANIDWP